MSRRAIRALSFVLGLALVTVGFAVSAIWQTRALRQRVQEAQTRALTDAVGHLEAMAEGLGVVVAGERPLPALIALRHEADLAAAALGQIQFAGQGGEALRRFAACTAEISGAMADDLAVGLRRVPDYALLIRLRDYALPLAANVLPSAVDPASGRIEEAEFLRHFADLGRLYYDGVGSDVVPPSGYLSLQRGTPIAEAEARAIAAEVVGGSLHLSRAEAEGEPERYCFTSANLTVSVSRIDGHLLTMLYDRRPRAGDVGPEAARAAAVTAVEKHLAEAMTVVEQTQGEGCYYFTFAPTRDGILCLSERVIVGIDTAGGRLSLWDADRYYRYATPIRTLPEVMLTPETAALRYGVAGEGVLCTAVRRDGRELLCYRLGEGDAVIYVNAVTGKAEPVA